MNNSILVVGSNEFYQALPEQIRDGRSFIVEVANNIDEASSWVEIRPPDILLVQASLDDSQEFCLWLKEQVTLSWLYCILIEDRAEKIAQNRVSSSWELAAAALEESADAYVWFGLSAGDEAQKDGTHRLILAHIQAGVRKIKKYRELLEKNNLLSAIALADPLTELNNRRALDWNLPERIATSRNHDTPLSLMILDVDRFKAVNDTYGHLVGDRILQLLSSRLRHNLRFQDTLFRYGGEEFVIILSNSDCEEALFVANRLCSIIREQTFAISSTLTIDMTISIGASCLQNLDDDRGVSLLDRADRYLLQAKAAGRDRVMGCEERYCLESKAEYIPA
ncbi:GGDEF domain-containing protein [Aliterella atlantica]|uniref:Diguanylate cyclase n=1 Tax=Aliterella atlantica CENA595 TaxID=1618023 RepID=A0A0D8ZPV6_9CYAN|nr:diguanylate cyclase [Aliterella atlantica]KJH70549.1 diguanylate cyclase [Aliterella atlantica CENA595]